MRIMMLSVFQPAALTRRPAFGRLRGLCRALLLLLLLSLAPAAARAQSYYVEDVEGSVRLVRGTKSAPVQRLLKLTPQQTLRIGQGGEVRLLNAEEKEYYILSTTGQMTVAQFIADKRNSVIECTIMFFRYLLDELLHGDEIVQKTEEYNVTAPTRDAEEEMMKRLYKVSIEPADSTFREDAE